MIWKCVDCGYEDNSRWLMCPECTTPEDWAAMRAEVTARNPGLVARARNGPPSGPKLAPKPGAERPKTGAR